jgi:hypothetical protein
MRQIGGCSLSFVKVPIFEYCSYVQVAHIGALRLSLAEFEPVAYNNQGGSMAISEILATIDQEIAQLQQARALLGGGAVVAPKKKVGRPRKIVAAPKKAAVVAAPVATKPAKLAKLAKKKKRNLSPEGRKRIAEAVKKRWAAQKAAAAK